MKLNKYQIKLLSQIFADLGKATLFGGIFNLIIFPQDTAIQQIFILIYSSLVSLIFFYNAIKYGEEVLDDF